MAVARALYAFNGGQEGDLTFQEDDIIRILKKDESGWWEGQTDDGRRGDFPYNYVELVSPEEVTNIRETSRMVTEAKTKNKTAGDAVSKIKVTPIPKTPTFTVEATLARKKVQVKKSMSEFRVLDENIRSIYPNFDRPLPPMWADKVYVSEEASRKRAEVLKIYVQKLVGNEVAEYALISWMNPKESFRTSNEVRQAVMNAQQTGAMNSNSRNSFQVAMMNVCPLARVEYDWLANDAVELSFLKGDIIAIRSKETPSKGWWEGEASDGSRGLFPSNHVTLLNQNDARSVVMGEKIESSTTNVRRKPSTNGGNSVNKPPKPGMAAVKGAAPPSGATPSNRQRKTENNFSLPSLDAFDELLLEGFTMVENGRLFTPKPNADSPGENCLVTLSYIAYAWDCQKQRIIEFAASDLADERYYVGPLKFVVGKGETIKALERAVQHLEVGQESRIVVRPDLGYGDVGNPPAVPPNCHLVYDVRLEAFEGPKIPGPPPMLTSGTTANGSSSNLARSNGGSKTHRNPNQNPSGTPNGAKFTPPMSPMPVSPVPGVISPKASSYVPVGAVATPITKLNPPMPPQMGMMSPSNMQAVIGMSPVLGNRSLVEAVAARNVEPQNPYGSQAPIGSRKPRPAPEVQKAGKKEKRNKKNNSPRAPPPQENLPKYGLNEMKEIVANKSFAEARVDAEFLEDQLTDESFMLAFQMERKEFLMLPKWKQQKMKRGAGLY